MNFLSYLLCLIFFTTGSVFAQKETSNWFFGEFCGFNFSPSGPVTVPSRSMRTVHGSAIVSDRFSGDLLFYTDGRNFWNKNHELMETSFSPPPNNCYTVITQPAIIVPSADEFLYHVFSIRPVIEASPSSVNCIYYPDKSKLPEGESGFGLYILPG